MKFQNINFDAAFYPISKQRGSKFVYKWFLKKKKNLCTNMTLRFATAHDAHS